jgi:hypothetical protein
MTFGSTSVATTAGTVSDIAVKTIEELGLVRNRERERCRVNENEGRRN